jgi:hypothetical protein
VPVDVCIAENEGVVRSVVVEDNEEVEKELVVGVELVELVECVVVVVDEAGCASNLNERMNQHD